MHGTGRLLYEIISKLLSFIVKSRTYRTVYAPVRNGRVFTDTRRSAVASAAECAFSSSRGTTA